MLSRSSASWCRGLIPRDANYYKRSLKVALQQTARRGDRAETLNRYLRTRVAVFRVSKKVILINATNADTRKNYMKTRMLVTTHCNQTCKLWNYTEALSFRSLNNLIVYVVHTAKEFSWTRWSLKLSNVRVERVVVSPALFGYPD